MLNRSNNSIDTEKALSKPLAITAFISIGLLVLGFGLLFLDDLFTLNFGYIKIFLFCFGLVISVVTFFYLDWLDESDEVQLENILGAVLVSLLLGGGSTLFLYASFNLTHKSLSETKPISFLLVKKSYQGEDYDQWRSRFGTIDCQLSDELENSQFILNVYDFMTVKRFEMGEICLADERRVNKE